MDPRHFSSKTKRDAYKRSRGHCEKCRVKLRTGNIKYDHRIPWEISRNSSPENCQCLCLNCDAAKTYGADIPIIAKVHRIYDRAIGIKRSSKKLPGGRLSAISKKISGEVVARIPRWGKHKAAMAGRQIGDER